MLALLVGQLDSHVGLGFASGVLNYAASLCMTVVNADVGPASVLA